MFLLVTLHQKGTCSFEDSEIGTILRFLQIIFVETWVNS